MLTDEENIDFHFIKIILSLILPIQYMLGYHNYSHVLRICNIDLDHTACICGRDFFLCLQFCKR